MFQHVPTRPRSSDPRCLELWEFPIQGPRQGETAILQPSRYGCTSAVGLDAMIKKNQTPKIRCISLNNFGYLMIFTWTIIDLLLLDLEIIHDYSRRILFRLWLEISEASQSTHKPGPSHHLHDLWISVSVRPGSLVASYWRLKEHNACSGTSAASAAPCNSASSWAMKPPAPAEAHLGVQPTVQRKEKCRKKIWKNDEKNSWGLQSRHLSRLIHMIDLRINS